MKIRWIVVATALLINLVSPGQARAQLIQEPPGDLVDMPACDAFAGALSPQKDNGLLWATDYWYVAAGAFAGIAQCEDDIPEIAVEVFLDSAGANTTCSTTGGDAATFASYVQAYTLLECRVTHVKGAQSVFVGVAVGEFVGGSDDAVPFNNHRTVVVG